MEQKPEYLSGQQAAKELGVTRARLYELARDGRIGAQLGGYWLFTRAELARFQRERAERPKGGRPPKAEAGTLPPAHPA